MAGSHIQFPVIDLQKMSIHPQFGSTININKLVTREQFSSTKSFLQRHRLLLACIIVILAVSTLDTCLVCSFKHVIVEFEQNPICLALIQRDPQDLTWFVGGKLLGNLAVVTALTFLFRFKYRNRNLVAVAVAGFQIALTFYLCLSDPISGVLSFDGLFSNSPLLFRRSLDSLLLHLAAISAIATTLAMIIRIRNLRLVLRNGDSLATAKQPARGRQQF